MANDSSPQDLLPPICKCHIELHQILNEPQGMDDLEPVDNEKDWLKASENGFVC